MKTWAKGWRVVLKCSECKRGIWAKNVGQTVSCDCDTPNFITDNPFYYVVKGIKGTYKISLMKVEEPY